MNLQQAIATVVEGRDLDGPSMTAVMQAVMTGQATDAQIGGLLVGLRMKGETIEEIRAAAEVMRSLALRVDVPRTGLVDTCGTGGGAPRTLHISTAPARQCSLFRR